MDLDAVDAHPAYPFMRGCSSSTARCAAARWRLCAGPTSTSADGDDSCRRRAPLEDESGRRSSRRPIPRDEEARRPRRRKYCRGHTRATAACAYGRKPTAFSSRSMTTTTRSPSANRPGPVTNLPHRGIRRPSTRPGHCVAVWVAGLCGRLRQRPAGGVSPLPGGLQRGAGQRDRVGDVRGFGLARLDGVPGVVTRREQCGSERGYGAGWWLDWLERADGCCWRRASRRG